MSAQIKPWVLLGNLNKIFIDVKTVRTIRLQTPRLTASIFRLSTALRKEGFEGLIA
jgi:hypothetical protein